MDNRLRVLILEDIATDAELIMRELRSGGLHFTIKSVETKEMFIKALEEFLPDLILSDYKLPAFDGLAALATAKERLPNIPFIFVSGAIGEEFAIETLKSGAIDYVLKDRLSRLVPTVKRALREAEERAGRKKSVEELRTSEEKLRVVFNSSPSSILVIDLDDTIIDCNDVTLKLYGYGSKGELIGADRYNLIAESDKKMVREFIEKIIKQGGSNTIECALLRKDGSEFPAEVSVNPLKDPPGHIIGFVCIAWDITERKKAEDVVRRDKEMLEKLVQEKTGQLLIIEREIEKSKRLSDIGALAAVIAHELRTPLATIRIAAHNIKAKIKNSIVDGHIANIEKKIAEEDHIINNILSYSQIKMPAYERLSIHNVIDECAEDIKNQFPESAALLRKNINSLKNVFVRADPVQIRELFNNILNNAYDAVPDSGGDIEIAAEVSGNDITIYIKDTGCGIDSENLPKVFNPFFTTKSKGAGLGLTVCYQIAKLHDWKLDVASEVGKGTTVTIKIPRDSESG